MAFWSRICACAATLLALASAAEAQTPDPFFVRPPSFQHNPGYPDTGSDDRCPYRFDRFEPSWTSPYLPPAFSANMRANDDRLEEHRQYCGITSESVFLTTINALLFAVRNSDMSLAARPMGGWASTMRSCRGAQVARADDAAGAVERASAWGALRSHLESAPREASFYVAVQVDALTGVLRDLPLATGRVQFLPDPLWDQTRSGGHQLAPSLRLLYFVSDATEVVCSRERIAAYPYVTFPQARGVDSTRPSGVIHHIVLDWETPLQTPTVDVDGAVARRFFQANPEGYAFLKVAVAPAQGAFLNFRTREGAGAWLDQNDRLWRQRHVPGRRDPEASYLSLMARSHAIIRVNASLSVVDHNGDDLR